MPLLRRSLLIALPMLLRPRAVHAALHDEAAQREARWRRLLDEAARCDAATRIDRVDAAVNGLIDAAQEPERRHWPTPAEALARGRGDCRAYAILKFFALREAGHAPGEVRVLYTRQRPVDEPPPARPHLVVWARCAGGTARVLDNLTPFPLLLAERADLEVLFGLDELYLRRGASDEVLRPAADVRPWRELLERRRQAADAALTRSSGCRPPGRCAG